MYVLLRTSKRHYNLNLRSECSDTLSESKSSLNRKTFPNINDMTDTLDVTGGKPITAQQQSIIIIIIIIDGFGVLVGILVSYPRGHGFDSRSVQSFVCMNMTVCIGSGCFLSTLIGLLMSPLLRHRPPLWTHKEKGP
jgi:hypothetical protein